MRMSKKLLIVSFFILTGFFNSCGSDDSATSMINPPNEQEDRSTWPDSGFFFIANLAADSNFLLTTNEKQILTNEGTCMFIKKNIENFTDSISQPTKIKVYRYQKELDLISCPRELRIFKFHYDVRYINNQDPENYLESDSVRFVAAFGFQGAICPAPLCHGIEMEYGYKTSPYHYSPSHIHAIDFNNKNMELKIITHNNQRVLKLNQMMMVATNNVNPVAKHDTIYARNIVIGYL